MPAADLRPSGLPSVGPLAWGSHFCQFYGERFDLLDSLIPYFKAGLEANEKCLWVTSDPLRAQDARTALRTAMPDLERRIASQQIEIIDHEDWYTRTGRTDADSTLAGWVKREQLALTQGFSGLRLTGNTYWVERSDWEGFVDYEARVSKTFHGHHILGLCSYCLGRCQPQDILDVVANHQFAVVRRAGKWQTLENASLSLAKDELHRLNAELESRVLERTAELERAVRARDDFLSVASHELKTPITSLQLYVQGILRMQDKGGITPEQLNGRLLRVQDQCHRLEKLVNNLLDVSRAEAKSAVLHREEFDLAMLVAETAERFAEEFARARCHVTVDTAEPVQGAWDHMRMEQVVTNLLQNAVRYAPGCRVEISVREEGDVARLVVSDDGVGIPESEHERIFERFAQAESQQFAGGFGLGLWIVRQVAQAHGGEVKLMSRPGKGAVFTVVVPRWPASPERSGVRC